MTTTTGPGLRALITAGQEAVRAAERCGSPQTVAAVDRALCHLPVTELDDLADRLLHDALRALNRAEDAEEWPLLADAKWAVSELLNQPGGATLHHPAVKAVATLAFQSALAQKGTAEGTAEYTAWERAWFLGLEAMRATSGVVYGEKSGRELGKRSEEFFTAVRRAVPYAALVIARDVLAEAARAYGLPVIGMRQPLPATSRWDWSRRIGDAVYRFGVMPPLFEGHPYGCVAVQRLARDGGDGPVRHFPLGPDGDRCCAVIEALYRI